MKNILLIVPTLYAGGGTERVLVNLANNLSENHNVFILARRLDNKFDYIISSKCKIITSFQPFKSFVTFNRLIFLLHTLIINLRFSITKNISFTNSISIDLGRFFPKKTIAFEHWPLVKYETHPILLKKIKKTYSKLDSIIVLNQNELKKYNDLLDSNNKNIHLIYNSTSPVNINIPKENIVLSIAHFNDQKRNDLLIESWVKIIKVVENWKLLIIGEGPNLDYCMQLIIKNKIEKYIEIIPKTSNVEQFYSRSKIFVLCSRFEALPMVLIEAKSYALPCISFDVESGPSEIIKDNVDGFLIEYNNTDLLSNKMLSLMKNEEKLFNMSEMAYTDYNKRFSPKEIYLKWTKILT